MLGKAEWYSEREELSLARVHFIHSILFFFLSGITVAGGWVLADSVGIKGQQAD